MCFRRVCRQAPFSISHSRTVESKEALGGGEGSGQLGSSPGKGIVLVTHVARMREELGLSEPGPVGLHCRV